MKHVVESKSWLYTLIPATLLAAITALVYYPSLHYAFQFDDIANIAKHFNIRSNTFSTLFFTGTRWLSYWLNALHYSMGKFDPFSYRVGNVAIHTFNGLLVFFILLSALTHLKKESFFKHNAFFIAFISSLLFLLHPVQTQTVSYVIQGELEGLAALFILSMLLCALKFSQVSSIVLKCALCVLLFGLAIFSCGSKEIAVISPALLVLFDWFFMAQGNWQLLKKRLPLHGGLFMVISGIYVWLLKPAFFTKILTLNSLAKNNIGNVITHNPDMLITPWHFFISQFKVILHYLWMFVWPFDISVEYDWMLVRGFLSPDCIFPLMVLLLVAYGTYKLLRRDVAHPVAFGVLWFAICMAPRSSIIASPELLVDYKTYTASFGLLLLLGAGLVYLFMYLCNQWKKTAAISHQKYGLIACTILLACAVGMQTVRRNKVWRSGLEFWQNVIENAPGKARAYNNYGVELSQTMHEYGKAIPYFKKAIAMDKKYPDPCNNLAVAYSHLGKIDDAIATLKHSLTINPYYPEGYNNLASFFLEKKEYAKAEECLHIALKIRPYYGKAYFNMGRMYMEKGEQEKAWQCFKDSCTKADLDTDVGFATYGRVSLGLKKYEDAIIAFTKILEINPSFPEIKFNLANAYFLAQKYEESIMLYQDLLKSQPGEYRAWYNKGEAHVKLSQFDNALACYEKIRDRQDQLPQLALRLAACYEKVGRLPEAKQELTTLAHNDKVPENVRSLAQGLLHQLQKAA